MPAKNIMKNKNNIAIIDYGMGNLFSVKLACDYAGLNSIITSDKHTIIKSNAVILPGVGAFGDAIDSLKRLDLISPIKDIIARKTDFLGICLGLQLLMSESEEFGSFKGLDIIEGTVKKFPTESKTKYKVKVPQVGWNQIYYPEPHDISYWSNSPLKSISNAEYMYFVHSFYIKPSNKDIILTETTYENTKYCSGILKENIAAFQFHPEKSAIEGIKIYKDWANSLKTKKGMD